MGALVCGECEKHGRTANGLHAHTGPAQQLSLRDSVSCVVHHYRPDSPAGQFAFAKLRPNNPPKMKDITQPAENTFSDSVQGRQGYRLTRLLRIFAEHTPGLQAIRDATVYLGEDIGELRVGAVLRISSGPHTRTKAHDNIVMGAPRVVVLYTPTQWPPGEGTSVHEMLSESNVTDFAWWDYTQDQLQFTSYTPEGEIHPDVLRSFPTSGIRLSDLRNGRLLKIGHRMRRNFHSPLHRWFIREHLCEDVPSWM